MRILNISLFANVIRFVVDATQMLRFNLPQSCWHLKSSAGSLLGLDVRGDRLFGKYQFAFGAVNALSTLDSQDDGSAVTTIRANRPGLTVKSSACSLRQSQFEQLTATALEQQRHS